MIWSVFFFIETFKATLRLTRELANLTYTVLKVTFAVRKLTNQCSFFHDPSDISGFTRSHIRLISVVRGTGVTAMRTHNHSRLERNSTVSFSGVRKVTRIMIQASVVLHGTRR